MWLNTLPYLTKDLWFITFLSSIHLICYPFIYLVSILLFCYLSICTLVLLATTHDSIVQILKCTLYIPHIMLTYIMYYICLFSELATLVNLHSNQRNCQGKARLKPSLPWPGIPCFSVYLLNRRGNSQVAAIPGSLKPFHNNLTTTGLTERFRTCRMLAVHVACSSPSRI